MQTLAAGFSHAGPRWTPGNPVGYCRVPAGLFRGLAGIRVGIRRHRLNRSVLTQVLQGPSLAGGRPRARTAPAVPPATRPAGLVECLTRLAVLPSPRAAGAPLQDAHGPVPESPVAIEIGLGPSELIRARPRGRSFVCDAQGNFHPGAGAHVHSPFGTQAIGRGQVRWGL